MKYIYILLLSIFVLSIKAQNYNMNNTSVTTCGGNFYDSGGSGGNYGASETFTKTFCPSVAGDKLNFNFTAFQTESATFDYLAIYDGPNTSAPTLGTYATTVGPGVVQATATNTSGCITFVFKSDASVFYSGWAAAITCVTPCETINSVLNSSTPTPVGGIIKVCQGQSVSFTGSGTFSSGSSAGAAYSWTFDNGLTGSGTTTSTTFTAPGVYVVNLNINKAGCINYNKINQIVQVSTTPSFSATTTSTTSICLGQTATLIGSVTPTPFVAICTPPITGTTYLPDGAGNSYSTSIVVDCYGSSQTVTSASDINNICMSLEHSYLGDLHIEIICPNGQIVPLKTYASGGSGTYLGNPFDDLTSGPGTGANYCFAMSGATTLVGGPTVSSGSPLGNSIAAGTYSPAGNFSGLVGCPLNGSWTIKITDNLGSDDGYIFNWDVNFNATVPASQSFTPTIVSQTWSGASITSTTATNAVITPTSTGTKCYTLTAVDNFGCSYTTVRCVTVTAGPYAGVNNTLTVCANGASSNLFSLLGGGVATTGTWTGPSALAGGNLGTYNPLTLTAGNYTYTVPGAGSCPADIAVITVIENPLPAATLSFTNPTCGNTNGIITINNTSGAGQSPFVFASSLGAISGQTVTGLGAGTPVITLTNNFGCTFTVSATLTMTPGPTAIAISFTNATCGNNNGIITFTTPTGGTGPFTYSVNNVSSTSPKSGLAPGTYSVTVRDVNGCVFTTTTIITNIPGPTAITSTVTLAGCGLLNGTHNVTGVTGGTAAYTYSVDGVSTPSLTSNLAAGTHTILVRDANGCIFSRTFVIGTANGPSSFTVNTTNSNCGLANGTSTVSGVVGGTPTYSFSFDGGAFATTTTSSGLLAGTHTVIVRDANSCTITATYSVSNNAPPTASVTSSLNVLCNGTSTGSLTVAPTGGTAPFTYTLTTPTQTNTTGAFTGLPVGTYSITLRDNFSCTATVTAIITQPTIVTGTTSSIPVNCFGNSTGTVSAGGSGGVGPYTYLWPALGSSTLATVGGSAAGTYTVTIRDANLCTITRTVTVTQPTSLTLTSTLTPATCGNANGSGTVTVAGGTTTYNYNWSNGGVTNVLTAATAGTYTLTVQDFNGCILTRTVTVTNIPGPTAITGTTTLASCNTNNGTHNITGVTGGTAAYTYSVDGVSTPSLTSNLAAGTHTILVRDANGCTFSRTFVIGTANGPSSFTVNTTNSNCGLANGTSTVSGVVGGTPTYSFSFDGGAFATTTTSSGLLAGTHTVIVRDANSCTITATYSVSNNAPPTASVTSSLNVLCNGTSTGSLTVAPTGGTAPFTYTLTTPTQTNTTGAFTGLPVGTYSITLRDNFGCTATVTAIITQPTIVTGTTSSIPVNCFGNSTGTVSAGGSGGVGPYTYLWPALGSSTLATTGGAAAGTYTVTIRDANLCTITRTVTVTQPTSLTLTSTLTPATCGNANGSGTVTVAGGTTPYNYNWSNGGVTNVLTAASAGTYTLTVQDFNGCILTRTVLITNIPGPTAIAGTTTQASCNTNNGTHNVTGVTGGTAAYTYSVDGVSTPSLTSNLAAGTHTILVRDANGCTFSTTFVIGTANGPSSFTVNTTNSNCGLANGTSTVSGVVGGTPTYSFSFDGGAFATTTTASGLLAGTHTVIVRDANSCTITATYSVSNNAPPTASVTSSLNVLCNGASTGSLTVAPTGGTAPFTYTLTTPTQTNTTGAFTGLPVGTYSITLKDNFGCTATVTAIITQPTIVTGTTSSIPVNCFGNSTGTVSAGGSGGVGPYIYLWPALGSSTLATTGGAAAGTYTVTIRDANLCTITGTVTVTQPTSLTLTSTLTPATCGDANGSGTVTVAGGTPTYNYNWSNGGSTNVLTLASAGTHTLTVQDFNGCILTRTVTVTNIPGPTAITGTTTLAGCGLLNGTHNVTGVTGGTAAYSYSVDGVSTPSLTSGLSAGTHTIMVSDANNCTFSTTFNINTANGPTSATVVTTNATCGAANGTSTVTGVTGGVAPYQYSFDGSAFAAGTTTTGLSAGTHTVIIRDVNSCTLAVTYTELNDSGPTASVTSSLDVLCNGASTGSVTVTPTGGIAPFTYTLTAPTQTNATGAFTGLVAGSYVITVRDNSGCTATASVTLTQPTAVTLTVTSLPASCFGTSTGTVSASGSGGVGPYTYLWPALASNTNATVNNVAAGTYSVTQTDFNGCPVTQSITVTQPTSLTLTSTLTPATCGNANGSGTVTVAGGTPAYTYSWSNGGITAALSGATAGTYTLNVTDFKACVLTATVTVTNIPGPTAITGTTTLAGCGLLNGTHNVTGVTGGTAAYSYSVDGVSTPSLTSGLSAGTHTLLVSDANNCTFSTTFNINTANGPTSATVVTTNANCGAANGTATVTGVTGGVAPYQYSFDGSAFAAGTTTTGLATGTHTLTVKDVNSCVLTINYNVGDNPLPTATVTNSININCFAGNTGSFTVTAVTGIAPFTYSLTAPVQTNTTGVFTGLPAGAYNVTVSDNTGCTTTASVTLTEPTAVTLTVTSLPVDCFGTTTGTVSASGSGGVGPYTYLWPALASNTNATVGNVAAGTYSVTQTDANGCPITQGVTVTQPTSLTVTSTLTPATCGNANGSGTVTVSGGTPAYSYSWSNGGITSALAGASAGTYTLNVSDFKACVLTTTVTVTNIPGPTAITGTMTLAGCGLSNGTHNVTGVTGGTAAYSYSVNGVSTGSLTSGLAAGTHTITVSDVNNCLFSTTFIIGTTTGPATATVTSGNASCGSANGTATVTGVTGGLAPYQYSFNGGAFGAGATTTGLISGTHTLSIQDANSCVLTINYNVLNNGTPTAAIVSTSNTSCFAGSDGGFTIAGSGGSGGPFTYTLTTPFQNNSTGIFTGLSAGTYSVITNDIAGCATTNTVIVSEPTSLTLTPSSLPATCFGAATGTINLIGSGGTPIYSYNLNSGAYQASSTFANQFSAIYTMGVKDANGCLATQTVQIMQPAALAIQVSSQNANCTAANGIGTATVSGGTPIYTYTWTGSGGAAATSNGLVTGSYTVTATDANGCVVSSPVVIGLTPGGTASITTLSNITCNAACDGNMTASMIGGAAPFTYSWSPGGQTSSNATNLCPNTYTCIITDFYGCKASISATITEPTVLTAIMNSNNVKCYGTATGTVLAAGSGGTGPYTYLWTTIPSTLSTVSNVAIGNYPCNITDANGCTITQSITVSEPTPVTLTSTVSAANCGQPNGSATVTASGGAPGAYTYTWSSGSNTAIQNSVLAGTYTILVQDANSCLQTLAATIPNTAGPVISILSQTNVSCFGGCNGIATTNVTGGVGTYIYSWSNGNVSSIAPNLCAQIYTVSVTDGAGCVASTSVNITQPTVLTVNILPTDPKCFGATNGFGLAAALGGTPGYTYTWTGLGGTSSTSNQLGAGNYGLSVTDANGCIVTSSMSLVNPPAMAASITSTNVTCFGICNGIATATSTNGIGAVGYYWVGGVSPIASQTATGLCAGTYTMIATDQNNCTASSIINITEPPILTANITLTGSVTCNGGNNGFAGVTPAGGTGAYSYTWMPGGVNAANASSLTAGIYSVTVADQNGCSVSTNTTILQPAPLSTSLVVTNPSCNGVCDGTGNVPYSGGAGTTTFLWLPGLQSGAFVNNLCAGNQTVIITSNGSCTTAITFTLTEPAVLTAVASATNSNCGQSNGKACVVVGGGTSPLSYLWSNGVNTLCNNNIVAGAHSFTVTDANGCIANASGLVNDVAGPVVSVTSQTNVSCFGLMNGAAFASITGGVPGYTISWSGNQATMNTTTNPVNFGDGLHNITVVDAAGCVGASSVNITQPPQLVSAIGSFTNVTCFGLSNGGATMLVNGGTTPYSYSWTPSAQTSSVMISVPSGTYVGGIIDGNGCISSQQVVISQPQPLVMSASSFSNISCNGGSNGQISTTVQGGTPSYTYSWTPSGAGSGGVIGGLLAGGYTLSVTDINNCSVNANFTILEPSALTSNYTSLPAKCEVANGSATVTVGGGTPTYTLNWNTAPAQQGVVATNMAPGSNWLCVITDLNGCSITQTVNVNNAPSPIFSSPVVTQPSCFGLSNGDITVNYTSGTAPYTITWSSPISQTTTASALTQSVAGISQGAYTAILSDSYGCSTSQLINVINPPFLSLITDPDKTICFGQTTQLSVSGQGGQPAYSYTWSPNPFVGGGPHTVNPTTTTTYTVAVSDTKGCSPSPKVITVNVSQQLNAIGKSVTLCHGVATVLTPTLTSQGNGGAYSYMWSPITGTLNSMTVIGNAPAVATTNTFAVTISDGCTIPNASAIFTVIVNPLPVIDFAGPFQGCSPLTVNLTGTSVGGSGSDVFTWTDNRSSVLGNGNPLPVTFVDSGKYTITLSVMNPVTGCSNTLTKADFIEVYPKPIASFYADPVKASILDPNINFINTSQGAISYFWDFGDPSAINGSNNSIVMNPSHGYTYVGEYAVNLVVTSSRGCKDTARINVEITPDFALYIPNTFTPDGNGLNDIFQPMGVGIDEESYRMDIFDRWGENIYTSNSFRKGWDGTVKGGSVIAEQGVYTYKIMVKDIQGGKHPMVGHVTVLRQN